MKLTINKAPQVKISEDMYGLFFEDINYGLDGGLHAEMLENRNFEAVYASGCKNSYSVLPDGKYAWRVYGNGGDGSALYIHMEDSLNEENPHYLVFQGAGENASFTNKAYDGLYMKKGVEYTVSFYSKSIRRHADVVISVQKNGVVYAKAEIPLESGADWKQYKCVLTVEEDIAQADFVVSLTRSAVMAFDQFSMMPSDAVMGIFRKDLVEMLARLSPSFLRFPGGCVVEGNTLANRYRWKESIGPVEKRRFNWNRWAVHNPLGQEIPSCFYPNYGQTLGVGYYEYFLLCEYLKAKALPVLSVGLACQYMSTERVLPDSEAMEEFIQDALDLIEFANGSTDTLWGAKRAQMGHPAPFHLEYIGVGNEQWETEESEFFRRAAMFEQRIHERYPEIKIIGSAGPDVTSDHYTDAWSFYRDQEKKNPDFVYAVDEHYYAKPDWMYENVHFYDKYDRNVKVFAGEYACHIPDLASKMNCPRANSLGAALAEAAFLTGVERNADVVVMACYAPLLARLGYTQWSPDLIWFNGDKAYGTPSYYVQQMYSQNRGAATLATDWDARKEAEENVYFSAVAENDGQVIVKAVNVSGEEKTVEFALEAGAPGALRVTEICGNPEDCNSIFEMEKIKPVQYTAEKAVTLKPYSFAVIRI